MKAEWKVCSAAYVEGRAWNGGGGGSEGERDEAQERRDIGAEAAEGGVYIPQQKRAASAEEQIARLKERDMVRLRKEVAARAEKRGGVPTSTTEALGSITTGIEAADEDEEEDALRWRPGQTRTSNEWDEHGDHADGSMTSRYGASGARNEDVIELRGITWARLFDPHDALGGDPTMLADAAEDALGVAPDEAYSDLAVSSAQITIEEVLRRSTLLSSAALSSSLASSSSSTASSLWNERVSTTKEKAPGVMLLMEQQGLFAEAISFGTSLIDTTHTNACRPLTIGAERDVRLCISLSCCALAQRAFEERRVIDGWEYLNQARHALASFHDGTRTSSASQISADLLHEIEAGLDSMLPECCLEHLALPLPTEAGSNGDGNNEVRRSAVDTLRVLIMQDIEDVSHDLYGAGASSTGSHTPSNFEQVTGRGEQQGRRRRQQQLLSSSYVNDVLRLLTSTELMMMMQQSFSHVVDMPMLTRQWPGFLQRGIYAHIAHGYYYRDYEDIVHAEALLERYRESTGQALTVERSLVQVLLGDMEKAEDILIMGGMAATESSGSETLLLPVTSDMMLRTDDDVAQAESMASTSSSGTAFVLATTKASYSGITRDAAMDAIMRSRARDGDSVMGFIELTEQWLSSSVLCRFRDTVEDGGGARSQRRHQQKDGQGYHPRSQQQWPGGRIRRSRRTTTSLVDYFNSPWIKSMAMLRSLSRPLPAYASPVAKFARALLACVAVPMSWLISSMSNSFLRSDVKRFSGFKLRSAHRNVSSFAFAATARYAGGAGGQLKATMFDSDRVQQHPVRIAVFVAGGLVAAALAIFKVHHASLGSALTTATASVTNAAASVMSRVGDTRSLSSPPASSSRGRHVRKVGEVMRRRDEADKASDTKHLRADSRRLTVAESYALVKRWQTIKALALGKSHNIGSLRTILDDAMLEQWTNFAHEAEREGWHWTYALKGIKIRSVQAVFRGGGGGVGVQQKRAPEYYIVTALINESAEVIEKHSDEVMQSYDSPYRVVYRVKLGSDGAWRIIRGDLQQ